MREPTAPAYYGRGGLGYDDWYLGRCAFATPDRPGFDRDLAAVVATVANLEPARTLDVACGTGFLTRHRRGEITVLDRSPRMLEIVWQRVPTARCVEADGLRPPFADDAFDRVLVAVVSPR